MRRQPVRQTARAAYYLRGSGALQVPGLFAPEAGRLVRKGRFLYTEQGVLWGYRAFSCFLLFLRMCRGENIRPELLWLRLHGFNVARLFGPLPWKETPDYRVEHFRYDKLPDFFALLERYGLRCNWSLCHYPDSRNREYVQRVYDIARNFWAPSFFEGVNEPHNGEKPDPVALLAGINTHGMLTSYGLYKKFYDGQPGLDPVKDFGELHTTRDSQWPRKARHVQELQLLLGKKQPWFSGEPAKAIEIGSAADHPPTTGTEYPGWNYTGGKTNPDEFAWHHGVSQLWVGGGCVHTEYGKWGRVPPVGSQQYRCVESVVRNVFTKIGPEWQTGEYNRSGNNDSPVDNAYTEQTPIWTYTSLHDRRAISVRCGYVPLKAINGWRIVERWGPANTFARLER